MVRRYTSFHISVPGSCPFCIGFASLLVCRNCPYQILNCQINHPYLSNGWFTPFKLNGTSWTVDGVTVSGNGPLVTTTQSGIRGDEKVNYIPYLGKSHGVTPISHVCGSADANSWKCRSIILNPRTTLIMSPGLHFTSLSTKENTRANIIFFQ
jgi:hypothetical protein